MPAIRLRPGASTPSVADFAGMGGMAQVPKAAAGAAQALKALLARRAPSMQVLQDVPVAQQAIGPEDAMEMIASLRSGAARVPSAKGPGAFPRMRGMRVNEVPPMGREALLAMMRRPKGGT